VLIDLEEDKAARAVVVGMLREADRTYVSMQALTDAFLSHHLDRPPRRTDDAVRPRSGGGALCSDG
jgi:hypothetical protein